MSKKNLSKEVDLEAATVSIEKAVNAKKCWSCGCFHSSLKAIRDEIGEQAISNGLSSVMAAGKSRLIDIKYDCLGCAECYPADAVNFLKIEGDACTSEDVERRDGWPPLPGNYTILRHRAPIAICTLTDDELYNCLIGNIGPNVAIIGSMQTENLGIERLIENIVANPNIRFLIICGADSQKVIGHLPGQSLVSLASKGIDESGKIIEARGKRPRIRNIAIDVIEHFRHTVEVIDRVGENNVQTLLDLCDSLEARNPGPAKSIAINRAVTVIPGYVPENMVSDPNGYFVIYPDETRQLLSMEHYGNNGVLDFIVEGDSAAGVYMAVIEKKLVSRLDHAAYLGRELARAEKCLAESTLYVQDAAPERNWVESSSSCGCHSECG